jgi:protein-disulfide isomerase
MNKGTGIFLIVLAFFGGLLVGNLTTGPREGATEVAAEGGGAPAAGAAGAAQPGDPERFRVPVTAQQPSKGPADALVTIVQFSDFECPFCTRVEPTLTELIREYNGKVRVVWRNNPLPFHQNATPAALAAVEAFKQGGSAKFWAMHEKMFANQRALSADDLKRYAAEIGLDAARFAAALEGQTHKAEIDADIALATRLGARGTPGFFINGRILMGAQPKEAFKAIIDDEIARANRLIATGIPKARIYQEITKNGRTEAAPERPAADQQPQQPRRVPDPAAVYRVPTGNSPSKGAADALVTIVQFSDYQCPFCTRVEPTITQLLADYPNDVRVVWKDNPLPFHNEALPAAIFAREALNQGGPAKFWAAHAKLFENQRALSRADLERYAGELGLNVARVREALDQQKYKAEIEADQALARGLGASGTPSFFINGRNLRGAQPIERFKAVIDEELAKARAKVAAGTPRARVYEETIRNGATEAQFIEAPGGGAQPGAQPAAPDADRVYNIPVPANAISKGNARARVVIQQFSDYQCPFCSRVEPTINQLLEQYGDRVRVIWRDYPLPFHQNAMPAAEAAREVFAQGGAAKFWAYHALLFQNQQSLDRPSLVRFAEQVGGINMARFNAALDAHTHKATIEADMAAVATAGAQIGTPSFFINGRLLQGAQPIDAFKTAIDRALAAPAN